jgi:ferritin
LSMKWIIQNPFMVKMALDEEDWASWNFLQWFVKNKLKKKILQAFYWIKLKL